MFPMFQWRNCSRNPTGLTSIGKGFYAPKVCKFDHYHRQNSHLVKIDDEARAT